MSYQYARYIGHVIQQPWALHPAKLAEVRELMRLRASGHRLSDEEIADRFGPAASSGRADAPRSRGGYSDQATAVIPIHGTIAHRADSFTASSGGTSSELIGRLLDLAMADDSVGAIVLDFDTPGGSVEGLPELAAKITRAKANKPITAHVNALAASAGYWLASQCTEIVCTPSGQVGSIGVFMVTVDETEANAKDGIKFNAISAGDHKLEGAPWEPLSAESRAFFQAQVNDAYRQFVGAVAAGRRVSMADVKKNFGQGRCYDARLALSLGMIDAIATMDETLARLTGRRGGPRAAIAARSQRLSVAEEHHAILAAISDL